MFIYKIYFLWLPSLIPCHLSVNGSFHQKLWSQICYHFFQEIESPCHDDNNDTGDNVNPEIVYLARTLAYFWATDCYLRQTPIASLSICYCSCIFSLSYVTFWFWRLLQPCDDNIVFLHLWSLAMTFCYSSRIPIPSIFSHILPWSIWVSNICHFLIISN